MIQTRIISSFFLIILIVFALRFDFVFNLIFIYVFSFLCFWEFFRLLSLRECKESKEMNNFFLTRTKINPIDFFQIFVIQSSIYFFSLGKDVISLVIILMVSFFNLYFRKYNNLLASIGILYIVTPFISLINFYQIKFDLLLLLFVIAFSTDIGGYVFGKLIKGPKIFPITSPNKTWAGFFGGIILSLLISQLFYEFTINKTFSSIIFWVIVFSVFCQFGDYLESYLKRSCNVKDSSNLIPGHGGILDRLDGILFLLIVMFLLDLMNYNFINLFLNTKPLSRLSLD